MQGEWQVRREGRMTSRRGGPEGRVAHARELNPQPSAGWTSRQTGRICEAHASILLRLVLRVCLPREYERTRWVGVGGKARSGEKRTGQGRGGGGGQGAGGRTSDCECMEASRASASAWSSSASAFPPPTAGY